MTVSTTDLSLITKSDVRRFRGNVAVSTLDFRTGNNPAWSGGGGAWPPSMYSGDFLGLVHYEDEAYHSTRKAAVLRTIEWCSSRPDARGQVVGRAILYQDKPLLLVRIKRPDDTKANTRDAHD